MDQPIAPVRPQDLGPAPQGCCPYCGARLYGSFYFCLSCATPYKAVDSVLPAVRLAPVPEGELVRIKAPCVQGLFWTYFGLVLGFRIACLFLFGVTRDDLLVLLFGSIVIFVATCIFGGLHWRSLAVQFRRFGFNHSAAWAGLAALAPLLALNWGYHGALKALGADAALTTKDLLEAGLTWPGIFVLLCLLPGVTEETAFRGLVQHWLQAALRPWRAILLAAALFTVLHFSILSAPYLFLVGLLLGWTKWKTGSLYPSMLIHALHNLLALALIG